ncbi:endonuclease-reverse transcriptase [Elysia marginata]|uniref:Endonuclease-reverse transcriptase n=1 Tax=Elysia marginata TaxID=1093978 RepID=A0AAV4JVA8_9GAST|nr:endonuclease-reverse transcriptase [Elysia marginata]
MASASLPPERSEHKKGHTLFLITGHSYAVVLLLEKRAPFNIDIRKSLLTSLGGKPLIFFLFKLNAERNGKIELKGYLQSLLDDDDEPLTSEVEAAIKDLKAGKSPGLDNIPAEIIKNSGEMGIKALHHLCCQIWKQQEWPEDWKLQEFVMLYKNGNSKECGNYRTIALISHASKILLIIILNRMKCKVEEELSDCQAGYRANRGTTDMLFVLQIIIEKIRDGNEEGYITFRLQQGI